jgi:hypothetical protein
VIGFGSLACSSESTNTGQGGGPIETVATITSDADDGVWVAGTDEQLHTGYNDDTIEVGSDFEGARTGLRFELGVPKGATIESARVELRRVESPATEEGTILIQVFDDVAVAPFDDTHAHAPAEHTLSGLWPPVIAGFAIGAPDEIVESPDLAELVQHVVNRDDWTANSTVGFVLAPDKLESWAAFQDSTSGVGARLRVTYRPP